MHVINRNTIILSTHDSLLPIVHIHVINDTYDIHPLMCRQSVRLAPEEKQSTGKRSPNAPIPSLFNYHSYFTLEEIMECILTTHNIEMFLNPS